MQFYLTRVELHHDNHSKDYDELHKQLYQLKFYRVTHVLGHKGWFDLPSSEYRTLSDLSRADIFTLVEKTITGILVKNAGITAHNVKQHYSLVVSDIDMGDDKKLKMSAHLQPTKNAEKLPPGEKL